MAWKLQQDSFTKCLVYFADGNTRTFYSLDWVQKYAKTRDRDIGLARLRKLIHNWGDKAKTALIYDVSTGLEIERYYEGTIQNN